MTAAEMVEGGDERGGGRRWWEGVVRGGGEGMVEGGCMMVGLECCDDIDMGITGRVFGGKMSLLLCG